MSIRLRLFSLTIFFRYYFSFCFSSLNILRYLFLPYSLFFSSSPDKFRYLFLACSLNLFFFYHSHNNLLLYHLFVSLIIGFFHRLIHFLYIYKKNLQNTLSIDWIRMIHYSNCIIFAHIPKMNSVSTAFNIDNSSISIFLL